MSLSQNYRWEYLSEKSIGDTDKDAEVVAFLDTLTHSNSVIVGVGARVKDDDIQAIFLDVAEIQSNGTFGSVERLAFGPDTSKDPEVFVSIPSGNILVGCGMRVHDDDVAEITLWSRAFDPVSCLLGADLHVSSGGSDDPELSWYVNDWDYPEDQMATTIITGIGARSHDDDVATMTFQVAQLQVVGGTTVNGDVVLTRKTRAVETQATDHSKLINSNVSLYLNALMYIDEAYHTLEDNSYFQKSYTQLDGQKSYYGSRQSWIDQNGYTLILNPNASTNDERYWGVMFRDGGTLWVVFRGTQFNSYNNWATNFQGAPASVTDLWNRQTKFQCQQWNNGLGQVPYVHSGFLNNYLAVADGVRSYVEQAFENHTIDHFYLLGHSLGGAMAHVCAVDLAALGNPSIQKPIVMTAGAPRVGDDVFSSQYSASVSESHNLQNLHDWVTIVPWEGVTNGNSSFELQTVEGQEIIYGNEKYFPMAHQVHNYYNGLLPLAPSPISGSLQGYEAISSLVIKVHTSSDLFAGTNADIDIYLLGVTWGPLDNSWHDDLERGSTDTFDLFEMFPSKVPSGKVVSDLYGSWVVVDYPIDFNGLTADAWKLDWIDIYVNGIKFTRLNFYDWIDWQNSQYRLETTIGYPDQ